MSTRIKGGKSNPESEGDSKSAAEGPSTKTYGDSERSLEAKSAPGLHEVPSSVTRPYSKHIRCLKDYMKDPKRKEPLIGLEYILEIRFKGRKMPYYECQLCDFGMELLPMIEHVTGQKHRSKYLREHYPEKAKRKPNVGTKQNEPHYEEKADYLRRIAREVETTKGLKMYQREGHERPGLTNVPEKKKERFPRGYKPENDPVRRQKALEYMEKFEITSDQEAALVIKIAQSLSKHLKVFCEKKATLNYMKTLPSLMSQGENEQQYTIVSFEGYEDQPGGGLTDPVGLTDGLAKLHSLLQQAPSTSHTHADSSDNGLKRNTTLHGLCSKDLATMSALKNSIPFQPESIHSGVNEWMKQFNQSASTFFQSTTGEEELPHFRSAQRMQCNQEDSMVDSRMKNWDNVKESYESKAHPLTFTSSPLPKVYHHKESYSSQRQSSKYPNERKNRNQMPSPSCSSESSRPSRLQPPDYHQSNPDNNLGSYSFVSGGSSHRDYQEQNAQLDYVMGGSSSDFITNMNQIRGHDVATLESMLQQLLPHYPDLQKINIHALAQALSEAN